MLNENKGFSKGDKIVFTRYNYGLGVKNGTIGTITNLDKQNLHVKLDDGKAVSFAPNLNPFFDHGWAITIHKSQGTTVDQTFVLASYEMNQNLAYVAMTRHRDDVHVFGSSLDFWRSEKLPEVLAKSGEKLSAADYLDGESLTKLMQNEDRFLTKIFDRLSNELEAIGAVTKLAFRQVADHFLGISREPEIRVNHEHLSQVTEREEVRAEKVLQKKPNEVSPFDALKKTIENKLHESLKQQNQELTPEIEKRINLQSERAAHLLFPIHTVHKTVPTDMEIRDRLHRAKYELDRIPEIREELMKEVSFGKPLSGLEAHMIAERRASIEGRITLEAAQNNTPLPKNVQSYANIEYKQNQAHRDSLAEHLAKTHSLSKDVATQTAITMIRYKETHGQDLSEKQKHTMIHVAHDLVKRQDDLKSEHLTFPEINFRMRKEADHLFRHHSLSDKPLEFHELHSLNTESRFALDMANAYVIQTKAAIAMEQRLHTPEIERTHTNQHEMGM